VRVAKRHGTGPGHHPATINIAYYYYRITAAAAADRKKKNEIIISDHLRAADCILRHI